MIAITDTARSISHLLIQSLLQKGHEIKVLISDETQSKLSNTSWFKNPKVQCVKGSILDVSTLDELFRGATTVYHLAECITFNRKLKNEMYRFNIVGTANVVNVALANDIKKLVFTSHYLALGDKPEKGVFDETTKWNNIADAYGFGWSKHLAEREIWRGINEGLNAVILNPGQLFGEDLQQSPFYEIYQYFLKKGNAPKGNFPWIDEADFVTCLEDLCENEIQNDNFLLYNEVTTYEQFLNHLSNSNSEKKINSKVSLTQLRRRANIVRWLPFLNKNKALLNFNILDEISKTKNYSNQKVKNTINMQFTAAETSYAKAAAQFKN